MISKAQTANDSIEAIRKKVSEGLIKGQKSETVNYLIKIQRETNSKMSSKEKNDLLFKVIKTFTSREAQEAYEISLNQTIDNPKEALKKVEECLQKEPSQLDCLIQKLKINYTLKNEKEMDLVLKEIGDLTRGTKFEIWTDYMAKKTHLKESFKNKMVSRQIYETPTEVHFVLMVLELERSLNSKNYSRAKEISQYLNKNFPDYPDNNYFIDKINDESRETGTGALSEPMSLYKAKCKTQSLSVNRKYRYDFDLCSR